MSDLIDDLIRWERGELTEAETVHFFQFLVDSRAIYGLQGYYQRTAQALLEAGLITEKEDPRGIPA